MRGHSRGAFTGPWRYFLCQSRSDSKRPATGEPTLTNRRVEEQTRINGDLGRLGVLLKLWLINDERTKDFGEATIRAVLAKIEDSQDKMHGVLRQESLSICRETEVIYIIA